MEETGIIRRLDALGRIVIPREFRKLHRIEVGDPLEMRANASGEITIRKVDVSAQLKSVGALAISALTPHIDTQLAVCSCEDWLLFSGGKSVKQPELPEALQSDMQQQTNCV
ncbi:MAG: AbrB/MazE/SpoVT family DNA-binding domain-containing protein, partial [Clostridiales bacterium]|nr:AbrB/MazE/SpoVT family DNA-binding domain-containing protein [Clostridiales bacterium]